jgi:small subunit ribosomal protein S17
MTNETLSREQTRPQRLRGMVIGAQQMTKTITVAVERLVWYKKLHKQFRKTKTFLVHDEREEARAGDVVTIEQSRPLSRRKHFRLLRIDARAPATSSELAENEAAKEEAP